MIPELKTNHSSEAEVITEQSNFDFNDMPIVYFGCFIVFVMILSFSIPFMIYLAAQIHRASKKNWVQRICIQLNGDIDCSIGWHKLHMQLKVL